MGVLSSLEPKQSFLLDSTLPCFKDKEDQKLRFKLNRALVLGCLRNDDENHFATLYGMARVGETIYGGRGAAEIDKILAYMKDGAPSLGGGLWLPIEFWAEHGVIRQVFVDGTEGMERAYGIRTDQYHAMRESNHARRFLHEYVEQQIEQKAQLVRS